MGEKIKLLQSVNSLGVGGNEIFVMNFFRHIDKSRFQVDFVIYDDTRMDFYDEVTQAGGRIFVCRKRFRNKYLQLLSQMWRVKALLIKEHYDVIHCHSCSFVGIFRGAIPGFLTKGIKVVTHAHSVGAPKDNVMDRMERKIARKVMSRITDMGCACSDTAGSSKYTESFIASDRYKIINNAIETDRYRYNPVKRREIRKKLKISDESFVIGNVGRLEHEKNHVFLLEILKKVAEKDSNAVLLLVGDGGLRQSLETRAGEKGIREHVIFTGQCKNAADYYQAMDCFVLPSYYEGLPFVLVEAQVNGLYCLVSDVVSRMTNASGTVMYLSLEEGADYWAGNILSVRGKRIPENSIEKVIEQYDIEKAADDMEKLYCDLLTGE